ncbi:MAG: D-alanine--D-alanine ligase [bacterium]|nr:D-alanine--D-alanine ligase [bacterium]
MKIRTVGIVLETREDAEACGKPLDTLYHWREPDEIAAICGAIERAGFATEIIGTPQQLVRELPHIRQRIDLIFNLAVGFISRSRMALGPALYELAGLPYSGADPYARMLSQNKELLKSFMTQLGIPTPPWVYLSSPDELGPGLPDFPLIVKPAYEGSSIGITADAVVADRETLRQRVGRLFSELQMPVIVEQFIVGHELKVGFIGSREPRFRGIIEDVGSDGSPLGERFLYFDIKTAGRFGKQARDLAAPRHARLLADCERLYQHFQPLDFGLFDIRIDGDGNHFLLELNADATLHPERSLVRCCELNGVPFDAMIEMILGSAMERWDLS